MDSQQGAHPAEDAGMRADAAAIREPLEEVVRNHGWYIREAEALPALAALDALVASLTAARQHAEYWERAFKGAHSRATAARQREQQLTQALTGLFRVAGRSRVPGLTPEYEAARAVLAGEAPPTAPEPRA